MLPCLKLKLEQHPMLLPSIFHMCQKTNQINKLQTTNLKNKEMRQDLVKVK